MRWLERWRRGTPGEHEAVAGPTDRRAAQLLVDVSVIYRHDARTGIQRVVRGVLLQMLRTGAPGYVVRPVFARRDQAYHYADPDFLGDAAPSAAWRTAPTASVVCGRGDIFLGLDLAAHLLPRHRRQVARWKAAGASVHLLVYDLLPVRQHQWFERKTVRNFTRWLRFLGRYADGAICISRSTRDDLRDWLLRHAARRSADIRTSVIRLGGDLTATAPSQGIDADAAALLGRRAGRPFILMVGTVEPRKAYELAIRGFETVWARHGDTAPDLILVGRPGWKTDALQAHIRSHVAMTRKLFWFDNASDELLDRLYREARGVIVPAYAEGFGLPVDEASRRGKPVLARDLPVFREAGRPAIRFFRDNADFGEALAQWIALLPEEGVPFMEPCGWDTTCDDLYRALGLDTALGEDAVSQPTLVSIAAA